jgi:hypothetical protein
MLIPTVHKTDYKSAQSIIKNGFDLNKFGSATLKTGQSDRFRHHPRGVYFSTAEDFSPEDIVSHPWDHREKGVLIFCQVRLNNPFITEPFIEGKFYQEWLSQKYGGSGAKLTSAMENEGYDGIVCPKTSEVVVFNPSQIEIDKEKTTKSLRLHAGFKEWISKE